jgi:hypothetical protein
MTKHSIDTLLARHAVTCTDASTLLLRCDACGTGFAPMIQPGGRLRRGYWRCPNACNAPAERR